MSHGHHRSHHHCDLKENSPRPPVEGEETSVSVPPPCCVPPSAYDYKYLYTPRPCSLQPGVSDSGSFLNAPLGFEPEGCSGGAGHGGAGGQSPLHEGSQSPPTCVQWAKNLSTLLHDTEGVELFKKYLEQEGKVYADTLNFWFACEGLKKQRDKDLVGQLVKVIFRKFIQPGQLGINEELRREVTRRMRQPPGSRLDVDRSIFDEIQSQVWTDITHTTYPNFLKSEMYLNYVAATCQGPVSACTPFTSSSASSGSSSSSSGGREATTLCGAILPTLHEDCELMVKSEPLPLTRDMLVATQARRAVDLRPKPESYAGVYLQHGVQQPAMRAYSSYNPVSRQDSELQSLSSDARTDSDAMSCTDSSVDGTSLGQHKMAKRMHERQLKAMKESANMNREVAHYNLIPRTQRIQEHCHTMPPERFAMVLTEKLEAVRRAQEAQDKLDRKLSETDGPIALDSLADVIRQKLLVDEDCSQAILDQHVSRVWSDQTPSRSPNPHQGVAHPYQARPAYPPRYAKKEKDVFSTFSSDSGNVHDWSEVPDSLRHFPKSKSVPDYADQAAERSGRNCARRSRQKTLEQTDSGVSVVSDTPPSQHGKDSDFVKSWLKESYQEPAPSGVRCKHRPAPTRHGRKYERSGSLERYPAQPFVADPSMPPLPSPHTPTQLEEARRRLIEDDQRWKQQQQPRQRMQVVRTMAEPMSQSNQSTLRKSQRPGRLPTVAGPGPGAVAGAGAVPGISEDFTRVMFWFCEEELPYRTKLNGKQVTLRQFKEILPKKGVYRYYFKTTCEEVDVKAIYEEVVDDNEELPLWEGKLIAQVKPVD